MLSHALAWLARGAAAEPDGKATPLLTQLTLGGYANVSEIVSELMRGARFRELIELRVQDADERLARLRTRAPSSSSAASARFGLARG